MFLICSKVITEILEYARDGFNKYRMEYKTNSSTIGIIARKKEHQFEITATVSGMFLNEL